MIGDGSFQMTAQELSTMIRMRSNSIIFIFNNLGYQIEVSWGFPPLHPPLPLCAWLIHTFFFRPQSTMVLITTSTTGIMPPLPVLCALQTTPSTSRILFYAARHTPVHICSLSRSRPPETCWWHWNESRKSPVSWLSLIVAFILEIIVLHCSSSVQCFVEDS